MKVTLSFTDKPNIEDLRNADIYKSTIDFPDQATYLIGYQERILKIAELISQLSIAAVYLSCKELGIKNQLIAENRTTEVKSTLHHLFNVTILHFSGRRLGKSRNQSKNIKIYAPSIAQLPTHLTSVERRRRRKKSLTSNLKQLNYLSKNDEAQITYRNYLQNLTDQLLMLFNADPNERWDFAGFHPYWLDSNLIKRFNNYSKNLQKEQKQAERNALKKKTGNVHPNTGKGRRPGAIPGEFMGIMFSSQLEIRFATEVESRGLTWIYEEKRLGKGNYLVDFHLPDQMAWVEVKGRFEPRDDFLLREIAKELEQHNERLFVYTSGRPFVVNKDEFQKITREEFWERLLNP